ncbi:MAG: sigma-70 family RNA polymerase sigma factor [Acidobacteriota bacterium]|nr:sigma-70 family RNA polymerase sigma factor [Acidobacteriota bacterium]
MADPEGAPRATTQPNSPDARLEALVRDYTRLVRHAIRSAGGRLVESQADDIEQRVFLSLWQQVRREQTIDHPTSYVYRAAVRETVRAVRTALARPEVGLTDVEGRMGQEASAEPSPEEGTLAAERGALLDQALATLAPDRVRAVRAHLQGFGVQEIMDLFGWDYQKARNLVARGMADLRQALRERGIDGV